MTVTNHLGSVKIAKTLKVGTYNPEIANFTFNVMINQSIFAILNFHILSVLRNEDWLLGVFLKTFYLPVFG